jgi:hypothetical protein
VPALRTLILNAVADVLNTLAAEGGSLQGVEGGVFVRKGRRGGSAQTFPCLEVVRGERPDRESRISFTYDGPAVPVQVRFLANDPLGSDGQTDTYDEWYQVLARVFREPENIRSRVPGVWNVEVLPLPEISPEDTSYSRIVGGMTVLVSSWEPRTAVA